MNNSSKILFRVDGAHNQGLGHLIRSIALAQMLKDVFEIKFICKEIPENIANDLSKFGFSWLRIKDESEFINNIDSDNIIVLDGYQFDTLFQLRLKATGAKLVCIDDLHDKESVADLIINHAPGITPEVYKAKPYTQYALGLKYVLLRPLFLEQSQKPALIERVNTLLICFGGSDIKNLTQSTLEVSLRFNQFKKIIVVTGAAYESSDSLNKLINSDKRIEHRHKLNENEMLNAILDSDLCIVPASGILLEVLSAKRLVISGKYVENQNYMYENNASLFYDAVDFSSQKVYNAISEALKCDVSTNAIIDGKSSLRICRLFSQLQKEFRCKIRPAKLDDLDLTYSWAINPEIRRYSFQKHQILKSEHSNWLTRKLNNCNCHYLILEFDQMPIGSIRFDIDGKEALLSYQIDPEYHGMGFGGVLIKKGLEWIINPSNIKPNTIDVIVGDVIRENIASIKTFERFGFSKKEQVENLRFEKWI